MFLSPITALPLVFAADDDAVGPLEIIDGGVAGLDLADEALAILPGRKIHRISNEMDDRGPDRRLWINSVDGVGEIRSYQVRKGHIPSALPYRTEPSFSPDKSYRTPGEIASPRTKRVTVANKQPKDRSLTPQPKVTNTPNSQIRAATKPFSGSYPEKHRLVPGHSSSSSTTPADCAHRAAQSPRAARQTGQP